MESAGDRIATVYTFVTGDRTSGSWLRHSARMALGGSRLGGALVVAVVRSDGPAGDDAALMAAEELVGAVTVNLQNAWRGAGKAGSSGES